VALPHEVATLLFGRDKDLELLHAFVGQSSSDGGPLMLSGAPGVGKTVLLEAVAAYSADAGLRVLRAAGAEFEADLSFAGLNQVLHPLFEGIEDLSPPQHTALEVALGLGNGPAPDQLVV
jgi:AAA ATPase domain